MKCAGNAKNPLACGKETEYIINGFGLCYDHAIEVQKRFKLLKAQIEASVKSKRNQIPPSVKAMFDPDLIQGSSLENLNQVHKGMWKNVKNTT